MSRLFVLLQYLLPHHGLSRLVGAVISWRWVGRWLIPVFARIYKVDMTEAERESLADYHSFNDFFTRRLKQGARPLPQDPDNVVSPADGAISQLGAIVEDAVLQAKGISYDLTSLLGGEAELARQFHSGSFATVYLAPRDYHRVHMPLTGTLRQTIYVPGRLFSVNTTTSAAVPNLFTRNERLVCLFDTATGPMAVILVGAMIVAGIEVSWAGQVCPLPGQANKRKQIIDYSQSDTPIQLHTGDELGLFKLGSTVIVLFAADAVALDKALGAGDKVRMGQRLAILSDSDPDST